MSERITGHTELLTLMAYPIRHSKSPAMHNEAAAYLGLDYAYLCFDVDQSNLKEAIAAMRALHIRGGNLSMPNKIAVMQYLDRLSPEAQMCGAVNTIVNDGGVLTGYITDGIGYMRSLEDSGIRVIGEKITVVGCGGAGKAMQVQAALDGVREMSVFNRRDEFHQRGIDTVAMINEKTGCKAHFYDLEDLDRLKGEISESCLLANATCVGMRPLEGQTYIPDPGFLRPDLTVTDAIYAPEETELLRMAREAGCRTLNGQGMMLFQGAAAFKLWTGCDMPIPHMKKVLGFPGAKEGGAA